MVVFSFKILIEAGIISENGVRNLDSVVDFALSLFQKMNISAKIGLFEIFFAYESCHIPLAATSKRKNRVDFEWFLQHDFF